MQFQAVKMHENPIGNVSTKYMIGTVNGIVPPVLLERNIPSGMRCGLGCVTFSGKFKTTVNFNNTKVVIISSLYGDAEMVATNLQYTIGDEKKCTLHYDNQTRSLMIENTILFHFEEPDIPAVVTLFNILIDEGATISTKMVM
jgi:hypothetical protein